MAELQPSAPTAAPQPLSKGAVFVRRLGSTLALWAVVTAAIVTGNRWLFYGLLALVIGVGLKEWITIFGRWMQGGWAWCLSLVSLGYGIALVWRVQAVGNLPIGIPEAVGLVAILFFAFWQAMRRPLEGMDSLWKIFTTVFGFIYVPLLGAFMLRLLLLPKGVSADQPLPGVFYLLHAIAVTKFTDMGAYAVGSLIGKHKMIPHISPGKTWEGLLGAFAGAFLASHGIVALWGAKVPLLTHTHAAILAVILAIVTVVGDLAESVIKRCLAVKDSGVLLPGIGGALDLIDSLLFTTPLAWAYLHFLAKTTH